MTVRVEGFTPEELLALPPEEFDGLIFAGRPVVFRAGSAEVLAEFSRGDTFLSLDLAHIDGGGEGVLPTIVAIAERYAKARGLQRIEWLVRATNCARPNPRLRAMLERRGFVPREVPGRGECYYRVSDVS